MAPASLEVVAVPLAALPGALGGEAPQALCLLSLPGPEGPTLLGDLAVSASVQMHPNPQSLPGSNVLSDLTDGLGGWALVAAMASAGLAMPRSLSPRTLTRICG